VPKTLISLGYGTVWTQEFVPRFGLYKGCMYQCIAFGTQRLAPQPSTCILIIIFLINK
jgi:hypothetical protein